MRNRKKKEKLKLLFLILLGLTVGYALLGTTLKINGIAGIKSNTFSIHWDSESVDVTEGSVESSDPVVSENDTKVSFTTTLELPGDFYEFTIDAVNDGTVDGMISDIKKSIKIGTENATLPEYIKFSVTYADGASLAKNHYLKKRVDATHPTKETYKVRLEYLESATVLPDADKTYTIDYDVDYQQADDNAIDRPVCLSESSATSIYAFDASTGTITGFSSNYNNETDLVIPCTIDGVKVVAIADGVDLTDEWDDETGDQIQFAGNNSIFSNVGNITSVKLNDGLESIGNNAFIGSKITTLTVPSSVKTIGNQVFKDSQIETLKLYNGLVSIGEYAFYNNKIERLNVPSTVTTIGMQAFNHNNITKLALHEGLVTIGSASFMYNQIEDVKVPSTVKSILGAAFSNNEIKTVSLPEGLETMESAAFMYNQIEELEVPSTLKKISSATFNTNKIRTLVLHEGLEIIDVTSFGMNDLREVTIPSTVTAINSHAFGVGSQDSCNGTQNLNLTTIHNKTGRSFNWKDIIGSSSTAYFKTGTVNGYCDKTIEITD